MRRPFRHQIPAWALTVAFTLTAQAADGVIEINQAIVEANDGFPYVISEPGSYILTGNLTVPDENTTAIEVQADHVTVDLNGFAIIGPVQCTAENGSVSCSSEGTGVGVQAQFDVFPTVVRNGSVRGMGFTGVSIISGLVKGIRALENGQRGIRNLKGIVTGCFAQLNGESGIIVRGTVQHSIALLNGVAGITLVDGVARSNASNFIFAQDSAVLGNWIGTELSLFGASGYADNIIDGVVTDSSGEAQPIGCNRIGGNLICPEGSAGGSTAEPL